jgi:hypothetical protein
MGRMGNTKFSITQFIIPIFLPLLGNTHYPVQSWAIDQMLIM